MSVEALIRDAYEAEDNPRKFAPFKFFANEIKRHSALQAYRLLEAHEEGVTVGIKRFIREKK